MDNILVVTYGTNLTNEVDNTLETLKRQELILSVNKVNVVDAIRYTIEFKNIEAAFLFGRTRPQIKI